MMWRRPLFTGLCVATLGLAMLAAPAVHAQTYPDKPIHIIVAFTPGSATDVVARAVAQAMSQSMGQPVVVDNRPGAGGTIAAALVAKAPPDGYTLLVHSSGHTVNPSIYPNLGYDTVKDLLGISLLAQQPNVLVAAPSKGWKTAADLVKAAQAEPDKLTYASAGTGSGTHMNAEKFRLRAKFSALHIPYKGTPEALNDTLTGRVDFFFAPVVAALSIVRDGKLVALAVGSEKRASVLPNVPTTEEAGYPGSAYNFWIGLLAPAGTPPALVARLNAEVVKALASPEVKDRLGALGADPAPMTSADFGKLIVRELAENAEIVKEAGIKLQ
jgi:tripartite-type tricarboxylate transporter receptor subunit TctC